MSDELNTEIWQTLETWRGQNKRIQKVLKHELEARENRTGMVDQ